MGLHTPKWAALCLFLATFTISLSITLPVVHSHDYRAHSLAKDAEETAATAWSHEVNAAIGSAVAAGISFIGYIKSNITHIAKFGDPLADRTIFFEPDTFARVASNIQKVYPTVEVMGTIPSGVITQSHPPGVFPYFIDLANSHDFSETIASQVETGAVAILVANLWFYGNSTIVGALVPVYNSTTAVKSQFWGFAAGLFRGGSFEKSTASAMMTEADIQWCLYCIQQKNRTREVIAGSHCSPTQISAAGLTVPLNVEGSCEWWISVTKQREEPYFTRVNVVLIVVACFLGSMVLNLFVDHICVLSRFTANTTANAPKALPFNYAIVSIWNGGDLWLRAPDDVTVIIAKFKKIANKACAHNSSYVSAPAAPHTLILTSRHIKNLITACREIQEKASDVEYSAAARIATQFPFLAISVTIHECSVGFISFDPSFHFDDGVGAAVRSAPASAENSFSGVFTASEGGQVKGAEPGDLLGDGRSLFKLREGGLFTYGGHDVDVAGDLFNRRARPNEIHLSFDACRRAQTVLPDGSIDYGELDSEGHCETFVVKFSPGRLEARVLAMQSDHVQAPAATFISGIQPEVAEESHAAAVRMQLQDEECVPSETDTISHSQHQHGVGSARPGDALILVPSRSQPARFAPSVGEGTVLDTSNDGSQSEDDENANPLSRPNVSKRMTRGQLLTDSDGMSAPAAHRPTVSPMSAFGASGTRDFSDFSRHISIPHEIEVLLERHFFEHVTMFRVGLDVPFEFVRVRLFVTFKAYELFFNGFNVNERRNVFQRLNVSAGVRVDDILAQLAVKCIFDSARK